MMTEVIPLHQRDSKEGEDKKSVGEGEERGKEK